MDVSALVAVRVDASPAHARPETPGLRRPDTVSSSTSYSYARWPVASDARNVQLRGRASGRASRVSLCPSPPPAVAEAASPFSSVQEAALREFTSLMDSASAGDTPPVRALFSFAFAFPRTTDEAQSISLARGRCHQCYRSPTTSAVRDPAHSGITRCRPYRTVLSIGQAFEEDAIQCDTRGKHRPRDRGWGA